MIFRTFLFLLQLYKFKNGYIPFPAQDFIELTLKVNTVNTGGVLLTFFNKI
jgi:hypothetical protein